MVRGPVRKQSMDPVRSGGQRTGGQSFRVTQIKLPKLATFRSWQSFPCGSSAQLCRAFDFVKRICKNRTEAFCYFKW